MIWKLLNRIIFIKKVVIFLLVTILTYQCTSKLNCYKDDKAELFDEKWFCDMNQYQLSLLHKNETELLKKYNVVTFMTNPEEEKYKYQGVRVSGIVLNPKFFCCHDRFYIATYIEHITRYSSMYYRKLGYVNEKYEIINPVKKNKIVDDFFIVKDSYVKENSDKIVNILYYIYSPKFYFSIIRHGGFSELSDIFEDERINTDILRSLIIKLKKEKHPLAFPFSLKWNKVLERFNSYRKK